jgi:cell division protein FtsL
MAPAAATKPRAGKASAAATKARPAKASVAAPSRAQRNQRALAGARAAGRAGAAPATRPAPARRKSGAAAAPAPARRKSGAAAPRKLASSPVARVLNSRGMPLVDRVLRGPVWVVMLGVLLAGIVFLNVSVLELNRGIARTDAKAAALERTNSGLRERVAKLDSGERIQQLAAARGFVMPQPGEVTFVHARRSDAKLAAGRITAPNESTTTTTPSAAPATTSTAPATQTGYTTAVQPSGTAVQPSGTGAAPSGTGTTPATAATPVAAPTSAAPTAATTQQVP